VAPFYGPRCRLYFGCTRLQSVSWISKRFIDRLIDWLVGWWTCRHEVRVWLDVRRCYSCRGGLLTRQELLRRTHAHQRTPAHHRRLIERAHSRRNARNATDATVTHATIIRFIRMIRVIFLNHTCVMPFILAEHIPGVENVRIIDIYQRYKLSDTKCALTWRHIV